MVGARRQLDRPPRGRPVGVAELSLGELAGRLPRERVDEVDRARALVGREPLPAELDEVALELLPWCTAGGGFDDRLDLLTPLVVRYAEHRGVAYGGLRGKQRPHPGPGSVRAPLQTHDR